MAALHDDQKNRTVRAAVVVSDRGTYVLFFLRNLFIMGTTVITRIGQPTAKEERTMNVVETPVIQWLLEGDVAIQYQTHRDLLESPSEITRALQGRIATEGWGARFIEKRDEATGRWGKGIYSPKWVSTHYTLLDLYNLGISPECPTYQDGVTFLLNTLWECGEQSKRHRYTDLCVTGTLLGMCAYGGIQSPKLAEMVDYLLEKRYPDGGWNCAWGNGDQHSSLHTTLSVLEGFRDYRAGGYTYRLAEMEQAIPPAEEFILRKQLFRSVRTGEIIDHKMLMLSYPCRWKYDVLRCMVYFASVGQSEDARMGEALELIMQKKRKNDRWPVQQKYSGTVHFDMEQTGTDSRWNTLRALRVLKVYRPAVYSALIMQGDAQATP
jgi:hypothetical protein